MALALGLLLWAGAPLQAGFVWDPVVLYDDTAEASLAAQGWLAHVATVGDIPSPIAAGISMDSRPANGGTSGQAGLFNHWVVPLLPNSSRPVNAAFPALDPRIGFTLSFELQVHDEDHVSNERAGFSVILLGMDQRGIELGFWEDRIWAQSDDPLFTQAEGAAFDTSSREVVYQLCIESLEYWLHADGVPLLRGDTRDYRPFSGIVDPYQTANLVFLGDDTNSAAALVSLGRVTLQIDDQLMEAIDECPSDRRAIALPPTWLLLLAPLALLFNRRTARRGLGQV